MRGVIALAAALSLPEHLADGRPFPQRNLIIFLTFSVILVTLVLQGLTLPALIRALGLAGGSGANCEETEARRIMAEAALNQLNKTSEEFEPNSAALYDDLKETLSSAIVVIIPRRRRPGWFWSGSLREIPGDSLELLRVERETAVKSAK